MGLQELTKLREAHTVLIGMIQNHHLSIGSFTPNQTFNETELKKTNGKLYVYKNTKYNRNCSTPNVHANSKGGSWFGSN